MSNFANKMPAHEQFGYNVVKRALRGERLAPWESDFARLFWQSLEIHNGGFEQWIGNTGRDGALDTLELLKRYGFSESHRLTNLAFEIVKLDACDEDKLFYHYLEANVPDWFERLRPLDEAYWDDADVFDEKLKDIYRTNNELETGADGEDASAQP